MIWRSLSDVRRNVWKASADNVGRSAKSESDRPFRVKTGLLVDGDIVVIISVDIVDQCTYKRSHPRPFRVTGLLIWDPAKTKPAH